MSAPANFLRVYRDSARRSLVVLVKIEPRDPVTLVTAPIYLSTAHVVTPAGSSDPIRIWLPFVEDVGSISAPGAFGTNELSLCSTTLVLAEKAIAKTLLLDDAAVTIYEWDTSLATFDDAHVVLAGGRVLAWGSNAHRIELQVRQRTNWNRDLTPVEVTPEAYPQAPLDSIGQTIPIVYGRLRDDPFRPPWPEYPLVEDVTSGTVLRPASLVLGGRRAGSAILVDTGRGAGSTVNPAARVLCASHKVKTVADHLVGAGFYLKGAGERMMPIEVVTPGTDIINSLTEAGIFIRDDEAIAWASALPVAVENFADSGENIRAVLDPWNDANYCRLDWTAGFKFCHMHFESMPQELGIIAELYVVCGYRSVASTNLTLRIYRDASPTTATDFPLPVSATRRIFMKRLSTTWGNGSIGNHVPVTPFGFSETNMEVGWSNFPALITGTGTAELFFAGFVVRFTPSQNIVQSERTIEHTETRPVVVRSGGGGERTIWQPYTVRETIPATTELQGKFFANVDGYADDGEVATAGAFTGGASGTLIERPPDVLAHMLVKYATEPLANVEQGVGAFGSFVDARALLKDARRLDMTLAISVGQKADINTATAWVAQGAVAQVILDRFTDKWRFLPWRTDLAVSYPWKFRPVDLVEGSLMQVDWTPTPRVSTGFSLGYGFDSSSKQPQKTTRLAWNGSTSGYKYRGLRDEYLTIVASQNDRLDFTTTAPFTALLTPGAYDGNSAAAMVSTAMKTANSAQEFAVIYGPTIIAGYNDQLTYRDVTAGVERTLTGIPAGTRASFDALCTEIAGLINAANITAPTSVTYSTATRRITFDRPAGSLLLRVASSGLVSRRLYATLGCTQGDFAVSPGFPQTSIDERAEERFAVGCITRAIDILWETGTNGLKGTKRNAASFLGFQTLRDSLSGGTAQSYLGETPKNNLEAPLLKTAQRIGPRKDTVEDLRAVLDTDTAREARARLAGLFGKTRPQVVFSTTKAPDLERGRVIEFSADFDAVEDYRDPDSDGSWAGKRFVVVETEQLLGPVAFYTKVKAVGLD